MLSAPVQAPLSGEDNQEEAPPRDDQPTSRPPGRLLLPEPDLKDMTRMDRGSSSGENGDMTAKQPSPSSSIALDREDVHSDPALEAFGRELMEVVKLATGVTAQWPGYLLFVTGLILVLAPVASKLIRVLGIGFGEFDSTEFVASVVAGSIVLIAGTILHASDNGLRKEATQQVVTGAVKLSTEARRFGTGRRPS